MRPERFVPHRVGAVAEALCERDDREPDNDDEFRSFVRIVTALFHFEFHAREQELVEAWEGVDEPENAAEVTKGLTGLLDAANYTPLSMAELDDALSSESLLPLRFDANLDDYDEVLVYRRGGRRETVEVPKFKGLRTEEKTMTVDDRVVVHTRTKPRSAFGESDDALADRGVRPGHVSLKQFQNVPRADIEMLLPSTQVRFRLIDSLIIGVPAVASGLVVLATKLLPTIGLVILFAGAWLGLRDEEPTIDQAALVALFGGVVALGSFLFKQWTKLKNRRVEYLKTLSENLYFRTINDGPGVLHSLLAAAEEQEVLEVLLSYRILVDRGPMAAEELDRRVEAWLQGFDASVAVDFEVDDAVEKLWRLRIVDGDDDELTAAPLDLALARLDRRWDALFDFGRDDLAPLLDFDEQQESSPLVRLRRVVDGFRSRLGDRRVLREE